MKPKDNMKSQNLFSKMYTINISTADCLRSILSVKYFDL